MKKLLLIGGLLVTPFCMQGAVFAEDIMFILNEIKSQRGGSDCAHGVYNTTRALNELTKLIARCEQGGKHRANLNAGNGKGVEGSLMFDCSELALFMRYTISDSKAIHSTHYAHGWEDVSKVPTESAHRIEKSWRKIFQHLHWEQEE